MCTYVVYKYIFTDNSVTEVENTERCFFLNFFFYVRISLKYANIWIIATINGSHKRETEYR